MRIVVSGISFSKGLSKIARRTGARQALQRYLTFETQDDGVTVSWTDGTLKYSVVLPATVEEEGKAVFPGRLLAELVSAIAAPREEITIASGDDERKAQITSGRQVVNLMTINPDEIPEIPDVKGSSFTIPNDVWKRIESQVVFAAATDDVRPVLAGVRFEVGPENCIFVTADGYRMSILNTIAGIEAKDELVFLVLARSIRAFSQLMMGDDEVVVTMGKTKGKKVGAIQLVSGAVKLVTPQIEGQFPDYTQLVPDNTDTKVTVDREELIRCITAVGATQESHTVLVTTREDPQSGAKKKPKVLFLQGGDKTNGDPAALASGSLKAKATGKPVRMAVNRKYLMESLKALTAEEVLLSFTSTKGGPMTVQAVDDESYMYVVMPMYVDESAFKAAA